MRTFFYILLGAVIGAVGSDGYAAGTNAIAQGQVNAYLTAHKIRDRKDEIVRQHVEKTLNRIEIMGCPRFKKGTE